MGILAFIPARSGSKGLPDKNIRLLNGRPLLAWTVQAALDAGCCQEVFVSTDSAAYAEIARKWGAKVPFLRPPELATDSSSMNDALWHAIDQYARRGMVFEEILTLQPTSPLRTAADVLGAVEVFHARQANAIISVCEAEHSPLWSNTLPADGSMEHFLREEVKDCQRQQLPKYYRLNGAIELARVDYLRRYGSCFGPGSFAYVMPKERSIDIDSEYDFFLAQSLFQHWVGKEGESG